MHDVCTTTSPPEEWRAAVGWEGFYEVSDIGRVRSLDRQVRAKLGSTKDIAGQLLRPTIARRYLLVSFSRGQHRAYHKVHRLVLEAFVGPCPDGMQACHNNGDRLDNRAGNLRWDTPQANMADQAVHGTKTQGTRQGLSKLDEDKVREIRRCVAGGEKQVAVAARLGVHVSTVNFVVLGRTWKHVL